VAEDNKTINRRRFLIDGLWGASLAGLGMVAGAAARKHKKTDTVWQIDPYTCASCGNCATYCVLEESAVKCVQVYAICGYCDFCPGYFELGASVLEPGAENELCPTGAITRTFVEEPYYEYTIDESLCIGCLPASPSRPLPELQRVCYRRGLSLRSV
jgi:electron transport complex protein RnfB